MKTVVLYTRRNVGLYALSFLVAKGFKVKVITDDEYVKRMCAWLNVDEVTLDTMGEYDWMFCVHGDKFIPEKYIRAGRAINFHPCLGLYKGHNPIRFYIKNKDEQATIDAHIMTNIIDEGELVESVPFATGVVNSYSEFYNQAVPFYYIIFEKVLNKLNIKP